MSKFLYLLVVSVTLLAAALSSGHRVGHAQVNADKKREQAETRPEAGERPVNELSALALADAWGELHATLRRQVSQSEMLVEQERTRLKELEARLAKERAQLDRTEKQFERVRTMLNSIKDRRFGNKPQNKD